MKNRYRNPWFKSARNLSPAMYENDAPEVMSYRGVQIFRLSATHFDYVFNECCITQRTGYVLAQKTIDSILDGNTPVDDAVAAHLTLNGFKPLTYSQYSQDVAEGKRD